MVEARRAGLTLAILSGRSSAAVARRMEELGISEVHQGVGDKDKLVAELEKGKLYFWWD